jgi:hypothetical protein
MPTERSGVGPSMASRPRFLKPLPDLNESDIAWLAGLLEGEGTFCSHRAKRKRKRWALMTVQVRVQIQMSDRDVVARVAKLTGASLLGPYSNIRSKKPSLRGNAPLPCWVVSIVGAKAEQLCAAIYPLMGSRRQAQIRQMRAERGSRRLDLVEREACDAA